jgi:hypothetical protein
MTQYAENNWYLELARAVVRVCGGCGMEERNKLSSVPPCRTVIANKTLTKLSSARLLALTGQSFVQQIVRRLPPSFGNALLSPCVLNLTHILLYWLNYLFGNATSFAGLPEWMKSKTMYLFQRDILYIPVVLAALSKYARVLVAFYYHHSFDDM